MVAKYCLESTISEKGSVLRKIYIVVLVLLIAFPLKAVADSESLLKEGFRLVSQVWVWRHLEKKPIQGLLQADRQTCRAQHAQPVGRRTVSVGVHA